jgi:hypothetical protein
MPRYDHIEPGHYCIIVVKPYLSQIGAVGKY